MSLMQIYDRVGKIRAAAGIVLKELDQLGSGWHMTRETFDTEVERIAREKLHPYGCDLLVYRSDDGITRFLIQVQRLGDDTISSRVFSIGTMPRRIF